jgi:ssDNA-binding Zn-finger/Zn-ribbon topoisomerase 1
MKNTTIRELSENTRTENPQPDKDSLDEHGEPYPCPECQKGYMRRIKGKNGYFWGCSEYRSGCKCTASDKNGKPCFEQKKEEYPTDKFGKPYPCQKCGQPLRRISKKDGTYFWGCSNYSNGCRFTAADNDGEPTFKKNLKRTSEDAPKFRMD